MIVKKLKKSYGNSRRNAFLLTLFCIQKVCGQAWVWDEISKEREEISLDGIFLLIIMVCLVWGYKRMRDSSKISRSDMGCLSDVESEEGYDEIDDNQDGANDSLYEKDETLNNCGVDEKLATSNSSQILNKGGVEHNVPAKDNEDGFLYENMTSAQIERTITSITQRDRVNTIRDSYGVIFNEVRRKLLKASTDLIQYSIPYGTEVIVDEAFCDCEKLHTVVIPDSVVYIGQYAFRNCTSLIKIEMPDFLRKIDNGCFMGCSRLQSVTLPRGIKMIHEYTFDGCSRIKDIVMKDNIRGIEKFAFRNCSSLVSFTIPMSVKGLQEGVFSGCDNLQFVTFWNSDLDISTDIFNGCVSLKKILINEGKGARLKNALPQYKDIIVEENISEKRYREVEFTDVQIFKKLKRRNGTLIQGVKITSVTITTLENYRRMNRRVDRDFENYYFDSITGTYKKELRNIIFTSDYRVRQLLKNKSGFDFLILHFRRHPQDFSLLMNGAEIILYREMVEANEEYYSIWND